MNAVYQSNVSGTVLIQPFRGDLANTETLPAYMLSTWLFQTEMMNSTGYSIVGLNNVNLTSIDYTKGTLLIGAMGNNGTIFISHGKTVETFPVVGFETIPVTVATWYLQCACTCNWNSPCNSRVCLPRDRFANQEQREREISDSLILTATAFEKEVT